MDYLELPTVKASIWLTNTEKHLEDLPAVLLPIATYLKKMEDCPPQSHKAGYAANVWVFSVLLKQCHSIQQAFDLLHTRCIRIYETELRKCHMEGWEIDFIFVIHMLCADRPDMTLSSETLKLMASYDASTSIDLYDYEDNEKEDFELSDVSPY